VYSFETMQKCLFDPHPSVGSPHFQIGHRRNLGAEHEVGIEVEGKNFPE
jgi:hypothetical protein